LFYASLGGLGLPEIDIFEALDLGEVLQSSVGDLGAVEVEGLELFQPDE
jgi:hypothetical protein